MYRNLRGATAPNQKKSYNDLENAENLSLIRQFECKIFIFCVIIACLYNPNLHSGLCCIFKADGKGKNKEINTFFISKKVSKGNKGNKNEIKRFKEIKNKEITTFFISKKGK